MSLVQSRNFQEAVVHLILEMIQRQVIVILPEGVFQLHADEVQARHALLSRSRVRSDPQAEASCSVHEQMGQLNAFPQKTYRFLAGPGPTIALSWAGL